MNINFKMEDLISTCRTCMKTDEPLLDLFSIFEIEDNTSLKIVDVLVQTTSLQVQENDNLPKKLCKQCENILRITYTFKKQALECENELKRLILLSTYIKNETVEEDFKNEDGSDFGNCYDNNSLIKDDSNILNGNQQIDKEVKFTNTYDSNKIYLNKQNGEETFCPICHVNIFEVNLLDHLNDHSQQSALVHNKAEDGVKNQLTSTSTVKYENIDSTIKCILCTSTFSSHKSLAVHLMEHYRNKPYKSDKTDKTYLLESTVDHKNKHFNIERQEDKYKCMSCKHNFLTEKEFIQHTCETQRNKSKNIEEEDSTQFKCKICGQEFEKKRSLISHFKVHTNVDKVKEKKSYICDYCTKSFSQKGGLIRHMGLHFKEKPYKCTECPKTYSRYDQFTSHMRKHSGIKPYACDQCDKAFTQLGSLKDHIRTHTGEKPYLCAECGKGFKNQSNLRQHVKRHSGIKPFACAYCPQTFCAKGQMKAHMETHSGEQPYACAQCGAAFTKANSLKKHAFLHTGLRPFACDGCARRFACRDHLRRHRRTHTGERPYRCPRCARAFTQCNDLRKHMRVHDGLLAYHCGLCGARFRLMRELKLHYPTHYTGAAAAAGGDVTADAAGAGGDVTITIERVRDVTDPHAATDC